MCLPAAITDAEGTEPAAAAPVGLITDGDGVESPEPSARVPGASVPAARGGRGGASTSWRGARVVRRVAARQQRARVHTSAFGQHLFSARTGEKHSQSQHGAMGNSRLRSRAVTEVCWARQTRQARGESRLSDQWMPGRAHQSGRATVPNPTASSMRRGCAPPTRSRRGVTPMIASADASVNAAVTVPRAHRSCANDCQHLAALWTSTPPHTQSPRPASCLWPRRTALVGLADAPTSLR